MSPGDYDLDAEISAPHAASLLNVSIPYVQKLMRLGKLAGRRGDRGWVTTRRAVSRYQVKRRRRGPGPNGAKDHLPLNGR